MRRLLILLLLTTTLQAKTWRDKRCGIEFELPRGWTVASLSHDWWKHDLQKSDLRCDVGIRPPGWGKEEWVEEGFLQPYAIEILVADRPFLDVARIGFSRNEGEWVISSRGRDGRATEFRTACCQALRGNGWSHTWNAKGELASVTYESAVLNDRAKHPVFIQTQDPDRFAGELDRIVKTFRFRR